MAHVNLSLLAPASVLILWTLVMLMWTAGTRFPAMARLGVSIKSAKPGSRGQDLDGVVPPSVSWKAHNHTHLHEQPTLFYALTIILTIAGVTDQTAIMAAWAYVALRIVHSLWQAMVNTLPVRFTLFLLSAICLIVLTVLALRATLA